jgi:acetolactate synthase-1/2/3 large subunit
MTGAEAIVRSLIAQGVEVVFGYPGGSVLDLYDELYRSSDQIRHVLTAHEQGAAHAADGYARATGRVGVVIATSGPGATNLVTGIATAYLDSVPLVAITGNVITPLLGKDSFQEVDIIGITIPVTKHSFIVRSADEVSEVLAEAFKIAASGRPGPVLIDVPKDVQASRTTASIAAPRALVAAPLPLEDDLAQAAAMLADSKRPYLYCGGGVSCAGASDELLRLADAHDAVIGCSMMGLAALPSSHPRNLGMTGMHGREASILAHARADLVVAVGARFSDRATGNKAAYVKDTRFLHIDIDAAEVGKNIAVDHALVGDLKGSLSALASRAVATRRAAWQDEVADMRAKEAAHAHNAGRLAARSVIESVRRRTEDGTVVATDVGQHQMWVAQDYPFEAPRTHLTSGGLGTMGYGLGAAIGGCLGNHARRTVLFTGDGSFAMNLNEMATAVSLGVPLVICIFNNGALGMVRQWQTLFFSGRYSNTVLDRKTDFVALARAFGANGRRVDGPDDLEPALDEAFASTGPFVVDCAIPTDDWVLPMIPPGGTVADMLTEKPQEMEMTR